MKKFHILINILLFAMVAYSLWAWFQIGSRPDKVGLHRCNSLEKLAEKGTSYSLIEVDVCIRPEGRLDVSHDEDTTFNLDVSSYFEFLQKRSDSRMWLDVKNLDDSTQIPLFRILDSLCHKHDVEHHRLIVESKRWDLLRPFTLQDFHTSYYVEAPKPSSLSDYQTDSVITRVSRVASSGCVRSLSFPGWWYTGFRNQFLSHDISFLIWRHRTTEWELFLDPLGRLMLADERVKAILIKNKGDYHR